MIIDTTSISFVPLFVSSSPLIKTCQDLKSFVIPCSDIFLNSFTCSSKRLLLTTNLHASLQIIIKLLSISAGSVDPELIDNNSLKLLMLRNLSRIYKV